MYGFGYGLSYTDFEISDLFVENGKVTVCVRNTGNASGKAVVQIYVSCPQGRIPKDYRRLAAFGKTPLLAPGETAELSMAFSAKQLASFDEQASAWVLEEGKYIVWAGFSLEESVPAAVLELDNTYVVEKTKHICSLKETLEEIQAPERSLPDVSELKHMKLVPEEMPETIRSSKATEYKEDIRKEAERWQRLSQTEFRVIREQEQRSSMLPAITRKIIALDRTVSFQKEHSERSICAALKSL